MNEKTFFGACLAASLLIQGATAFAGEDGSTASDEQQISKATETASGTSDSTSPYAMEEGGDKAATSKKAESGSSSSSASSAKMSSRARRMSPDPTGYNMLGLSAGLTSGMGLSYRRYLNDFIALRMDGLVFASEGTTVYSIGLSGQQDFLRTPKVRLYAVEGVALHRFEQTNPWVGLGAGLGVEYDFENVNRGFCVRGELVLTAFYTNEAGLVFLTPVPQFGVGYVF